MEQLPPASSPELEAAAEAAGRRLEEILVREAGPDPRDVRQELQRTMDREVGVVRDEPGLRRALERLRELRWDALPRVAVRRTSPAAILQQLRATLEVENMLLAAEAVTASALERRESRGNHHRVDHPERDDAHWRRNIIVVRRDGELVATPGPVDEPSGLV